MSTDIVVNTLEPAVDGKKQSHPSLRSPLVQRSAESAVKNNLENSNTNVKKSNCSTYVQPKMVACQLSDGCIEMNVMAASMDQAPMDIAQAGRKSSWNDCTNKLCAIMPMYLVPTWLSSSLLDSDITAEDDDDDMDVVRFFRRKTDEEMRAPVTIPKTVEKSDADNGIVGRKLKTVTRSAHARRVGGSRRPKTETESSSKRLHDAEWDCDEADGCKSNRVKRRRRISSEVERLGGETAAGGVSETPEEDGKRRGMRRPRDGGHEKWCGREKSRRECMPGKRTRTNGFPSDGGNSFGSSHCGGRLNGGKSAVSKDAFSKHESKKGWLVCKACRADVWPPNCFKHVANCRGRKTEAVKKC